MCESKHWISCGADGRSAVGVRSRDYQIFWDGLIYLAVELGYNIYVLLSNWAFYYKYLCHIIFRLYTLNKFLYFPFFLYYLIYLFCFLGFFSPRFISIFLLEV